MNASDGSNHLQHDPRWLTLTEFTLASEPGNDRLAAEKVAEAIRQLPVNPARLERLKTAVSEAALNALEHGSHFQHELPVAIRVRARADAIQVDITDFGPQDIPSHTQSPDLAAKLRGEQTPRGWGFFLIEHMVDAVQITNQPSQHTIELFLYLEGAE
ncbi:MAG: ATP-binding protein [Anaerolineales bacterium]|jgi:anti-sigma regulatory factor (Ser/Thr protein kinase)